MLPREVQRLRAGQLPVAPACAGSGVLQAPPARLGHVSRLLLRAASALTTPLLLALPPPADRLVLKTCGTTKLLSCVPFMCQLAAGIGMAPARVKYTRASFLFPEQQPAPHTSFEQVRAGAGPAAGGWVARRRPSDAS